MAGRWMSMEELYAEALNDVINIGNALSDYAKRNNGAFDIKGFAIEFDCLLQYSFLELALADNNLDPKELNYIRDLTKYGDLVNVLNANAKWDRPLTWAAILNSSERSLSQWVNNLRTFMAPIRDHFTTAFALTDAAIEELDLLADFQQKVMGLMMGLFLADGTPSAAEQQAAQNSYLYLILREIASKVKKYER